MGGLTSFLEYQAHLALADPFEPLLGSAAGMVAPLYIARIGLGCPELIALVPAAWAGPQFALEGLFTTHGAVIILRNK